MMKCVTNSTGQDGAFVAKPFFALSSPSELSEHLSAHRRGLVNLSAFWSLGSKVTFEFNDFPFDASCAKSVSGLTPSIGLEILDVYSSYPSGFVFPTQPTFCFRIIFNNFSFRYHTVSTAEEISDLYFTNWLSTSLNDFFVSKFSNLFLTDFYGSTPGDLSIFGCFVLGSYGLFNAVNYLNVKVTPSDSQPWITLIPGGISISSGTYGINKLCSMTLSSSSSGYASFSYLDSLNSWFTVDESVYRDRLGFICVF